MPGHAFGRFPCSSVFRSSRSNKSDIVSVSGQAPYAGCTPGTGGRQAFTGVRGVCAAGACDGIVFA